MRCRSSRATRKSIGVEGILPAPSAGGKAQTSMVLGRGALPSVIQNSARRNEHVQLPSAGFVRLWAAVLVPALLLAGGCGSSKKSTSSTAATTAPATLALSITESGKGAKFTAPASTKGGLVTVRLTNNGKKPHGAQLFRITGGHTVQDAINATAGESNKTPDWIRAEGGIGAAAPGQSQAATVNLPAGKYAVVDFAGEEGPSSGPPTIGEMTVTSGTAGSLPATATTVTATAPAKDKYKWQISGPLKAGSDEIT